MLLYDRKRAFSWKWVYMGVVLTLLYVMVSYFPYLQEGIASEEPLESGWTLKFLQKVLTGQEMLFFLPVLCSFPYAAGFVEELKSGIWKFILTRIDRKTYLLSKISGAALSGGGILFSGAAAVMAVMFLLFLPLEQKAETEVKLIELLLPCVLILCRYFFFGALGALIGLWASAAVNNRYMAWSAPFMGEYLLIILHERYLPEWKILYPCQWLTSEGNWIFGEWGSIFWMLCLGMFAAWGFYQTGSRRLENA